MSDTQTLSRAQARRIALAAQGFSNRRPAGQRDIRHLRKVLAHTHLLQIDSIYVLERAHYVPVYSRLGAYPHAIVDNAAYHSTKRRELFEYWGHAASLLPVELFPWMRWRMTAAEEHAWGGMKRVARDKPDLVRQVYREVERQGPISARMLEDDTPRERDHWGWNWSDTKSALEWLFRSGHISVAKRPAFERYYDLTERVIPQRYYAAPAPSRSAAHRELVSRSAAALGVATEHELSDYFRLRGDETRTAIGELTEAGILSPVTVEGWDKPAFLHRDARQPRRVNARALLSPFDPVVWHRDRAQRLWDFFYRIEIYVPAPQRVHGYYVLPFLLGDRLVARVDLKADRPSRVLRVPAVWRESHVDGDRDQVAAELAAELRILAAWLGLDDVAVEPRGDLAGELAAAVRTS